MSPFDDIPSFLSKNLSNAVGAAPLPLLLCFAKTSTSRNFLDSSLSRTRLLLPALSRLAFRASSSTDSPHTCSSLALARAFFPRGPFFFFVLLDFFAPIVAAAVI